MLRPKLKESHRRIGSRIAVAMPCLLIVAGLLGYVFVYYGLAGTPTLQQALYSLFGAVLAGGLFAVLLRPSQFIGAFEKTLKNVLYFEPEFLSAQRDLHTINENVVKAAISKRFPRLANKIGEDMTLDDPLPAAGQYYFESIDRTIIVEQYDDSARTVLLSDGQTLHLRAPSADKLVFKTTAQTFAGEPAAPTVDTSLWVDGLDIDVRKHCTRHRKEGAELACWDVPLEGSELYEIHKTGAIRQNLDRDATLLVTYTHFVERAELTVVCPFPELEVEFSEIGIAAARVRKEQEGDGHTRYLLSGLLFPHQGYMLQFHRRDAC